MTTTSPAMTNSIEWSARSLLRSVLAHLSPRKFAVQLWDGEQWPPESNGPANFELIFRSPNVVRSIFSDVSSLTFGEAYIYGHLDVQGSLIAVFESGDRLLTIQYPPLENFVWRWLWSIPAPKYPRMGTFSGFAQDLCPHRRAPTGGGELSLRSSGGVLEIMAGRISVLQLRVFRIASDVAERRATEQTRLHLPQVAAETGTTIVGHGMWLGRVDHARRGKLRSRGSRTHA